MDPTQKEFSLNPAAPKNNPYQLAILRSLRWVAVAAVIIGFLILLVWGFLLASWQGFSPDGPPPGFKPLPRIIFAILAFPRLFYLALVEFPWISRPILAYGIAELVWRFAIPKEKRVQLIKRIRSHAAVMLLAVVSCVIMYATLAAYAQRRGSAEFCVFNDSGMTCRDVVVAGNGFTFALGTMLPGDRRFCVAQPEGESPITIRCKANGTDASLSFTGGVEDSRKYYYQFTIGDDLRGEFGAWRLQDRPSANDVMIRNYRSIAVSNILVTGLGFSHGVASLPAGGVQRFRVRPMGPAIFTVEYQSSNGVRQVQSWHGWGREGHKLMITIGDTIDVGFQ